jgi:ketosteroid isomerase-like protein
MDNVELIRGIYAAFEAGDVPGVLATFDPNIEWYEAEHNPYWPGKAFVGPQAIVEGVFARLLEDFDGFRVDVQRLVGCGQTVLAENRYGGTAKATGEPLDLQVAHVWDVRDGKVVRWQQYCDTWELVRVLGVSPAGAH